jgi:hypothetical protein
MLGRNLLATDLRVSAGHTLNQSMVVQLTSEGNLHAGQDAPLTLLNKALRKAPGMRMLPQLNTA